LLKHEKGESVKDLILQGKEDIGLIHVFENIAVYADLPGIMALFQSKRMRKRAGSYVGAVLGVRPVWPRVPYQYLHHTPGFKKRQAMRKQRRKMKMTVLQWRDLFKTTKPLITQRRKGVKEAMLK
jgi:hypothetical protein